MSDSDYDSAPEEGADEVSSDDYSADSNADSGEVTWGESPE